MVQYLFLPAVSPLLRPRTAAVALVLGAAILVDTTPTSAQEWRQYRDNRETYEDDYIYRDEDEYDRGNDRYRYDPYREEYVPRERRRRQFRPFYQDGPAESFRQPPARLDLSVSARFLSKDCAPGDLCTVAIQIRNEGPRTYTGPLRIQNDLLTNPKLKIDNRTPEGWRCNQSGATTNCMFQSLGFQPGRTLFLELAYRIPEKGLSRDLRSCAKIQFSSYGGGEPSVEEIQSALAAQGYNPGPIDGSPGRKTRDAVSRFQRNNRLRSTGILSDRTIELLFRNAMTASGDLDLTNDRSCSIAVAVAPFPPEAPAPQEDSTPPADPVSPDDPLPPTVEDEINSLLGKPKPDNGNPGDLPRGGGAPRDGQEPVDLLPREKPQGEPPQSEQPQEDAIEAAPSPDGARHKKAVSSFHRKRSSQAHEKATSELTETAPAVPPQNTPPEEPPVAVPLPEEPVVVVPLPEVQRNIEEPQKDKPEPVEKKPVPKTEPEAAAEPAPDPKSEPEPKPEHVKWKSQLHEKYSSSQHDKKTSKRADVHDKALSKFHDKYKSVQHNKETSKLNKEHTKSISSAVHSKARSSVSR